MSDVRERPVTRSARTEQTVHPIRKIGVVGAGQMGSGIAHVCALSGLHVMLNDIAPNASPRDWLQSVATWRVR